MVTIWSLEKEKEKKEGSLGGSEHSSESSAGFWGSLQVEGAYQESQVSKYQTYPGIPPTFKSAPLRQGL